MHHYYTHTLHCRVVTHIAVWFWPRLWAIDSESRSHQRCFHGPTGVYTHTIILAYDLSMIRSLLRSYWSTTRLCLYTLTSTCWLMICPWPGRCFGHNGVWPACVGVR
jgi:hypothetical protein